MYLTPRQRSNSQKKKMAIPNKIPNPTDQMRTNQSRLKKNRKKKRKKRSQFRKLRQNKLPKLKLRKKVEVVAEVASQKRPNKRLPKWEEQAAVM